MNKWHGYLEKILKMFSFKNFFFIPTLEMQTVTFPPHIKLEFHTHEGNIQSHELAQNIREVLISVMEDKLQRIERDTKHNDTKHNKIKSSTVLM
jgi:hypothetical protein